MGVNIMPRYIHHHQVPWQWLHYDKIYPLPLSSSMGVIILCDSISTHQLYFLCQLLHYIFTTDNIWWGGDYIILLYFHPWEYLVRVWLCHDIDILTVDNIWWWGDYVMTIYFHSWQYLVRGDFIITFYFHSSRESGTGGVFVFYLNIVHKEFSL